MNGFSAFVTLQKVDVAKREVWGVAAVEMPDRAGEIMDYEMSKGNFVAWSQQMEKATNGKSMGNVRGMHADIAAGKVIHFEPNDEKKLFYIGTKIVDDNEWRKVLEGVYTGFSVGGSYGKKWADPAQFGLTRYEAKPVEISLVDVPCIPGAQFEVIKADGAKEMRKFVTVADAADLAKGDKDGHPFRGNQWTNGTGEHNGIKYAATGKKGTNRMTGQEVQEFEDIEERSPSVWVDEEGVVYNDAGEVEENFYENMTGDPDLAAMQRISDRDIVEEQILKPRRERAEAAAAFEVFDPDDFTDYEQNLVSIHKTATRKGILPIQDSKARQALSREAAAIINGTRSSGYTVYDSDLSAFNGTSEPLGSFAGVGYGSGESAGKVRQMVGILNERGYKAMPTKEGVIVVYHPKFSKAAGAADLAKGDKDGHPFRGNQWTEGQSVIHNGRKAHILSTDDESKDAWINYEDNVDEDAIVPHSELSSDKGIPDRVTDAAGTEADFNAREEEKKRRLQQDRARRQAAGESKRAAAREKFVNSKPAPATGSAQEKAMGMTEAEFNALDEMGYVKPWGVSEEGMSELKSMRQQQNKNKSKKQKAAGPGDLIKLLAEANMNADELIKKLQGSSDPAMMGLATQLSKAFPPPKKKAPDEGKDEPAPEGEGGDKPAAKGKANPFAKEKDGAEEEAVPGEETAPGEEDDAEMESGDIPEDEIDPKTGEPVEQAGQMSPEQAEAVKMVVISLLEELGLVQRQESAPGTGGMQLSVSVTGLAKAMGVQGLSKRFDTVLGDVGKLATAVDDLEKRLGVMPVLREMGGNQNPLLEQQAELLKGMLNSSNDPTFQQAVRNELATLEIKKIQNAKE